MSYYLNSNTVTSYGQYLSVHDSDNYDLYLSQFNWGYQGRNVQDVSLNQGVKWASLWPTSSICSGDPSNSLCYFGQDNSEVSGVYESPNSFFGGIYRPYFITGYVKDALGNAIASTTVKAFRTSDDVLIGSTTTDSNGAYQAPTTWGVTSNHYIVAYDASGLRSGSTVNTLVPGP